MLVYDPHGPGLADLRALLGGRCPTTLADREHHGHGESYHAACLPDAVCRVLSTEEANAVMKLCAAQRSLSTIRNWRKPIWAGTLQLEGSRLIPAKSRVRLAIVAAA